MGDEFHFLFECIGLEKLRILVIPKYYRTRCSTLKMTQLLNTNDRKLLMKVAKFVHLGMKEYTSLPDVSEGLREDPYHWTELPSSNKDYYYYYYHY